MTISPRRTALAAFLAALIFWLPIPWGSVTPAAMLAARVAAALALVLALALRRAAHHGWPDRLSIVGLLGLALLSFLQSIPLPAWLGALLSPGHLDLAREAAEVTGERSVEPVYLSLAPTASRSVAATILMVTALFIAGFAAGRHARHRRWLGGAVLVAAFIQVFYGLRPWLAGEVPRVRGTYVNPDHLAVHLEIALCVGLAAVWGVARSTGRSSRLEVRVAGVGAAALLWIFLFAGLLFTGSRAGLASALVGVGAGSVLLAWAWRRPKLVLATSVAGFGLVVGLLLLSGSRGLDRLLGTSWHEVLLRERPRVWLETLPLLRTFPLTGSGLGSFQEAFPLVQEDVSTRMLWGRAHNDFLELAVTGGFVGIVLGLVCVAGVVRSLLVVLRFGLRTEDRLAAVAGLSALAAVATHEIFDFGLSLPANAATLAVLLGAAAAGRVSMRNVVGHRPRERASPRAGRF
jgi:O-antigen ligase